MRVAICDDNSFDLKAVQEMFRRVAPGHTLDAFSDGRKLLEAIVTGTRYDLLFLDILMPGISGMELAREVNRVAPIRRRYFSRTATTMPWKPFLSVRCTTSLSP